MGKTESLLESLTKQPSMSQLGLGLGFRVLKPAILHRKPQADGKVQPFLGEVGLGTVP